MSARPSGHSPEIARPRRLAGGLLALAAACVVALAMAELALRLAAMAGVRLDLAQFRIQGTRCLLTYHPERGWQNPPNSTQECFGSEVRVDSHGFRGPEISTHKPRHTFRVLVLGDSFAWGWGVAENETVPHFLEDRIRGALGSEPRVEVANAGVSGYGTVQELLLLHEWGARLKPDVVVLDFYGNDCWNNVVGFEYGYPKPTFRDVLGPDASWDRRVPRGFSDGRGFYALHELPGLDHLLLYETLVSRAQGNPAVARAFSAAGLVRLEALGERPALSFPPRGVECNAVSADLVAETERLATSIGARTLVVYNPHTDMLTEDEYRAPARHDPMPRLLAERGIHPVDVFLALRDRHLTREELCQPNHGEHYSAVGNHVIAELIQDELAARGWLPASTQEARGPRSETSGSAVASAAR